MKLDPNDLQFENFTNFDGSFAYAQNKVSPHVILRCVWCVRKRVSCPTSVSKWS